METVFISKFEYRGRTYNLLEVVPFVVEYSDGMWLYSNDVLGIMGWAFSRDEVLQELYSDFDFTYRNIGLEDESELNGKAIELKRELLRLFPQKNFK